MKKKKQLTEIESESLLSEMEKLVVYGGEEVLYDDTLLLNDVCRHNGDCHHNTSCDENGVCIRNNACTGFTHCRDVLGV